MQTDDRTFGSKQEEDVARFIGEALKIPLAFGDNHIRLVKAATEFGTAII